MPTRARRQCCVHIPPEGFCEQMRTPSWYSEANVYKKQVFVANLFMLFLIVLLLIWWEERDSSSLSKLEG